MSEELQAVYHSTFYRDIKTGKCTFTVQTAEDIPYRNNYGTVNCMGYIPIYNKGLPLKLTGDWEQNKKGTWFFKIEKCIENTDDKNAVIRYLKNSAFAGVGEILASNILDYTGNDIYRFLEENENAEELIAENVKGITQKHIHNMVIQLKQTRHQQEIFQYIKDIGGDFSQADKLYSLYQNNAIHELERNPFQGHKADMDFYLCDALAYRNNLSVFYRPRLTAILHTAIETFLKQGNTYITLPQLKKSILNIEKKSIYHLHIHYCYYLTVATHIKHIRIFYKDGIPCFTFQDIWKAEQNIVKQLKRIDNSKKEHPFKDEYVTEFEKKYHISYGNSQKQAFQSLKTSGVKIITGGPGTGKTTTIKGFLHVLMKMYPNEEVLLLAPTGRASQRMKETTNHLAFTVHKGLEYKPFDEDGFAEKNRNNPFTQKFIIVDEVSMIDVELMSMLCDAIENGSTLFLFGDEKQLPSVGPGNVFHDLMRVDIVSLYRLTDVYRQDGDSAILSNTLLFRDDQLFRDGILQFKETEDFQILRVHSETELIQTMLQVTKENYHTENLNEVQILSPMLKKNTGCLRLNRCLQDMINPKKDDAIYDGIHYRINDKIIFLMNNYQSDYFNGDIGTITDISDTEFLIDVNGEDIHLPKNKFCDIMLAYAITIHKSQGSEFPVVIIALPKAATGMAGKNLIFTAITRAIKKVIIISEDDALETALQNTNTEYRQSNLIDMFEGNIQY